MFEHDSRRQYHLLHVVVMNFFSFHLIHLMKKPQKNSKASEKHKINSLFSIIRYSCELEFIFMIIIIIIICITCCYLMNVWMNVS